MLLDPFTLPVKFPFTHMAELHRASADTDDTDRPSQRGLDSNHTVSLHTRYGGFRVYRGRQNSPWTSESRNPNFRRNLFFQVHKYFHIPAGPLIIGRHEQLALSCPPNHVKPHSYWPLGRINAPAIPYKPESNAPFRVTSEHSIEVPLVLLNAKATLLLLPHIAQKICRTRHF
jgi:hypothetical protein